MSDTSAELEFGPVDYLVVEYAEGRISGEGLPHLIALVEAGTITVIDLVVVSKGADGAYEVVKPADLADVLPQFALLDNAALDVLDDADIAQVADVLAEGAAAIMIVYENTWAEPLMGAMRRSGGQVVAGGRILADDLLAALEADDEAADAAADNADNDDNDGTETEGI